MGDSVQQRIKEKWWGKKQQMDLKQCWTAIKKANVGFRMDIKGIYIFKSNKAVVFFIRQECKAAEWHNWLRAPMHR